MKDGRCRRETGRSIDGFTFLTFTLKKITIVIV